MQILSKRPYSVTPSLSMLFLCFLFLFSGVAVADNILQPQSIIVGDSVDAFGHLIEGPKELVSTQQSGIGTRLTINKRATPSGAQRTVVALMKYADQATEPSTLDSVKDIILRDSISLDTFLRANSFDAAWLSPVFVDWHTLPKTALQYNPNSLGLLAQETIAAIDAEVDFSGVTRLIIILSGPIDDPFTGGRGSMGNSTYSSNEGTVAATVSWIYTLSKDIIFHEFGHNLGFHHASSLYRSTSAECSGLPNVPVSLFNPTAQCFTISEYGDGGDTMGSGLNLFSTSRRASLGYIPAARVQTVSSSGTYQLYQAELPISGVQSLKVPVGKDLNGITINYWVEYRQSLGYFDSGPSIQVRINPTSYFVEGDPVMVESWSGSHTLRFQQSSNGSFVDLSSGHPFTDPYRGIKFEFGAYSGAGDGSLANINVSLSSLKSSSDSIVKFPETLVGVRTSEQDISFQNAGATSIALSSASILGVHSTEFSIRNGSDTCSNTTLAPGGTCDIKVIFSPQNSGNRAAYILLPNNDPLRPLAAIDLYGNGTRSSWPVLDKTSIDFGSVPIGTIKTETVTLSNTGNLTLGLDYIALTQGDFSVANNTCIDYVPQGTSCSININYAPGAAATSDAVLSLGNSFAGNGNLQVQLSGTGVGDGTKYLLRVNKSGPGTVTSNDGLVNCGSLCARYYDSGSSVTLAATATNGAAFIGWHGDCSSINGNLCVTSLSGNKTVLAEFGGGSTELVVTSPSSSANWQAGSKRTISWQLSSGAPTSTKLELWRDFALLQTISSKASTPLNGKGTYTWQMPIALASGASYQIKVITSSSTSSFSTPFKISSAITLSLPKAGSTIKVGKKLTLRWSYLKALESKRISIDLLRSGRAIKTIGRNLLIGKSGKGSLTWLIPKSLSSGNDYYIRISVPSVRNLRVASLGAFTIVK